MMNLTKEQYGKMEALSAGIMQKLEQAAKSNINPANAPAALHKGTSPNTQKRLTQGQVLYKANPKTAVLGLALLEICIDKYHLFEENAHFLRLSAL